jgi:hypothetical protein
MHLISKVLIVAPWRVEMSFIKARPNQQGCQIRLGVVDPSEVA